MKRPISRHDLVLVALSLVVIGSAVWHNQEVRAIRDSIGNRYDRWIEPLRTTVSNGFMSSTIETPRLPDEDGYTWTVRHWDAVMALRSRYIDLYGQATIDRYDQQPGYKPGTTTKEPR